MTPHRSKQAWKEFLSEHPEAHLLQTTRWGDLKAAFGWETKHVQEGTAGAQLLLRRLPTGLSLAYIPKGPLGDWLPDLIPRLDALCRKQRAFALKVEPDEPWDPSLAERLQKHGFRPSPHPIQPPRTLIVDLSAEEEDILARMHQKTRYNVRLAGRKEVDVRPWSDLEAFADMIQKTADRNEFGVHVSRYYHQAYELFHPTGHCETLVATFKEEPLAALMVFAHGRRAWYFYGASTSKHRNRMPTYLLQWEAMRWARAKGCTSYDLWGVPDEELDTLEDQFTQRTDGLWGVYRFKRGFGGELVRSMGAWDRPYNRPLYFAYRTLMTARSH